MGVLTNDDLEKITQRFTEITQQKHISQYTVKTWTLHWYNTYKVISLSDTTKQNYISCINKCIINSPICNKNLADVTTADLQSRINYLYQVKNFTRTTKLLYDIFKQIFRMSTIAGETQNNIAEALILPTITTKKRDSLSESEIKLFLSANNLDNMEQAFVYLALLAGLRRGEILALSANDIDLNRKIIFINKTLEFPVNKGRLKFCPKSKAGIRTIPIVIQLESVLEKLLKYKKDFLFTHDTGELFTKSNSYYFWKKVIKKILFYNTCISNEPIKLNIDKITPHVLRHTYATTLYYSEVGIKDAQYLLGHSSIEMTMDTYTHLKKYDNKLNNNVISKLDNYINKIILDN